MRPLAQTFLINAPVPGVEAVFVTAVDIFFASKPATAAGLGVELQIRSTLNGVPQSTIVPYGTRALRWVAINTSSDASTPTRFVFTTPVMLRTNELYAVAVVPLGGTPDYRLWTGQRGLPDITPVTSGAEIVFPNNVGNLYAPSNDLSYTVKQDQCLKFSMLTANFTSTSGTAVFKPDNVELFAVKPPLGSFKDGERVVVSNNFLSIAALSVSLSPTTFTVGEVVVQPNTATNTSVATAYGTVYQSNSTVTLLENTIGKFSTTGGGLRGLTSSVVTANPTVARTNASSSNSTTINVPTTIIPNSDFAVNNFIYVGKSNLANVQVARITAVDAANRLVTLDRTIPFTDSDIVYGRVKSDGNLFGYSAFTTDLGYISHLGLSGSSANTTDNFSNVTNQILIGTTTGSTANVETLLNFYYDSITSQLSVIDGKGTSASFAFSGYGNNNVADSSTTTIFNETPYEFTDRQRLIYSRSNELAQLSGNKSLTITAALTTSNTKFAPYMDRIRSNVIVTSNQILPEQYLEGFYLNLSGANGTFAQGSIVWQANATTNTSATVAYSKDNRMVVYNLQSSNTAQIANFVANGTSIITGAGGTTANVSAVSRFNEALGNGSGIPSRYISKNVVLAEGQDSEDLAVFLTAYRPAGTDIKVYAKLLNAADSDPFDDKSWTPMIDTSATLFSSSVNKDDYVELKYEMPESVQVHTSNISVNTTSAIVNFTNSRTSESFTPGMFVYIADSADQTFSVRRVLEVPNTSALIVASNLTFTSTNAAIGYIPGSLAQCNAFRYNENNGIVRYVCSSTDSVFESYKTFAIKMVLTSNETSVVPRIADMRALALQI